MTRRRPPAGFTLIEMVVVLSIMAILATVVVTSVTRDWTPTDATPATVVPLATVLRAARRTAVDSGRRVHLVIDPSTQRYEMDLAGLDSAFARGSLVMPAGTALATDSVRAQWWFDANGTAIGDSLRVSGGGLGSALVAVQPWTGDPAIRRW